MFFFHNPLFPRKPRQLSTLLLLLLPCVLSPPNSDSPCASWLPTSSGRRVPCLPQSSSWRGLSWGEGSPKCSGPAPWSPLPVVPEASFSLLLSPSPSSYLRLWPSSPSSDREMRETYRKRINPAPAKMSTNTTTPPLMPPMVASESPADATITVLVYLDAVTAVDPSRTLVRVMDGLNWAIVLANVRTIVDVEEEEARESVASNAVVDVDV